MPRPIFQLGPIERRIYEVARSTCEEGALEIDLATFRLQIGYQNPPSNFKAALKQIVMTDGIPDYYLELIENTEPATAGEGAPRRGRLTPRKAALGQGVGQGEALRNGPEEPFLKSLSESPGESGSAPDA